MKREMDDLMNTCIQILTEHNRPPRMNRQLAIEQAIVDFNPDCEEACEILDALASALNNRYRSDRLMVVEEEARALKIALKEAEPSDLSPEDEAYSNWRAEA